MLDNESQQVSDSDTYRPYSSFYVRYAESGAIQNPTLTPITDEIPSDAEFSSPLYWLKSQERERLEKTDNPYRAEKTVAKEIQDQAEEDGRVYYPVHVETDSVTEVGLETAIESVSRFIKREIPVSPDDCEFYFSGGRSIHVHVPLLLRDKDDLQVVKDRATAFNEKTDAPLDTGIYSRKRQFRLPGVQHDSGMTKVWIRPDWSRTEIVREAVKGDQEKPDTYLEFLQAIFGNGFLADLEEYIWRSGATEEDKNSEKKYRTHDEARRHNGPFFSPYANAGPDSNRSVAVIRVMGQVMERNGHSYVPVDILGAVGCDGEYSIFDSDSPAAVPVPRPLKLSVRDRQKWGFETPDYAVIIGGQSRNSRLFDVSKLEAHLVASSLEADGREAAIEALEDFGYETGSAGNHGGRSVSRPRSDTEAARIQREIERTGPRSRENEYHDCFRVACRLLKIDGWDRTWNWFRQQYGEEFDPEATYDRLAKIVEAYPEYAEVTVPDAM